jgi:FkbM family methyltransferase
MKEKIHIGDFLWSLDNTDNIGKHILSGQLWEPHLINFIQSFLNPGHVCLDIGACFGWHTLYMAKQIGDSGTVYAFEPIIENVELLNENINQNNIKNVQVFENAVGHKDMNFCMYNPNKTCVDRNIGDSFVSFNYDLGMKDIEQDNYVSKSGAVLKVSKEKTTCKRIDSINFEKKIDFIKIDCDWHDAEIILSAKETIKKHQPIILFEDLGSFPPEWDKKDDVHAEYEEAYKFLYSNGYSIYKVEQNKLLPESRELGVLQNMLAIPEKFKSSK